jgi:predicted O-methyltransferase YrrM
VKVPRAIQKILPKEKLMEIAVKSSIGKVKWKANRCNSLEDYVNLAFSSSKFLPFPWVSISPTQVKEEIMELLKILARHKPQSILEIGTAKGGTLFLFTRIASHDARIISIDLPGGRFGGGYPEWRIPLYESFTMHNQYVYLIRGDSHAHSTLKRVKGILDEEGLSFLFIDGDHTYEGVKKDFEMYSNLVGEGGVIAFHDIVPGPPESVGGVPMFWNEIKHQFDCVELVKDWKERGFGIGVILV